MINQIDSIDNIKDDGLYFILDKTYGWANYIAICEGTRITAVIKFSMIQYSFVKTHHPADNVKIILTIVMDNARRHEYECKNSQESDDIMRSIVSLDSDMVEACK